MYFPDSYGSPWPNVDAMAALINAEPGCQGLLPERPRLEDVNVAFRNSRSLHYRYDEVKIVRYVVANLHDFRYAVSTLKKSTENYNNTLRELFGPDGKRPAEYREFFFNFEKQTIFDDWHDDRCWIFYPIFFRHLWVSLLVAQIPLESFDDVATRLPLVSGVIGEKLLTVRARLGWGHPISAVGSEAEVISLMSIVAAQCGLHKMDISNGIVEFRGDGQAGRTVLQTVRVDNGWRQFSFFLESHECLFFDRFWRECQPTLDRYRHELEFRANLAKASIMSRNFSHNVGSHALANPSIYDFLNLTPQPGKEQTVDRRAATAESVSRLKTFHGYAQGRLDFMARAMTGSGERPEPLFFVGDVLNGFLRQGVLLNALLEDGGYDASQLEFEVEIATGSSEQSEVLFKWNDHELRFIPTKSGEFEDVLVGIPGGKIACHALYAFLENVLRNAVKYRRIQSSTRTLHLLLHLDKCKAVRTNPESTSELDEIDAWNLRITDNISLDTDFEVSTRIRRYINSPLISDAEGTQFPVHGHGIQEMKVCAEILAGGASGIRFPADGDDASEQNSKDCGSNYEYRKYLQRYFEADNLHGDAHDSGRVRINSRQALRCYSSEHNGQRNLVYSLLFPKPTLLGIVSLGKQLDEPTAFPAESIKCFDDLNAMAKTGVHLGLILDVKQDSDDDAVKDVLQKVAVLHPALPFRLMVLTARPETWRNYLTAQNEACLVRPPDSPFICGKHIPAQRLRVVDAMAELIHGCDLTTFPNCIQDLSSFQSFGAVGCDAFVLWAYDLWIRTFKPLADATSAWKLCIGFDCDSRRILGDDGHSVWGDGVARWGKQQSGANTSVAILVKTRDSGSITSANWPIEANGVATDTRVLPWNELLVIDHHGIILADLNKSWLKNGPRFYQAVGLDTSLDLFQAIENPPASPFGFAFLILALVEAALTQVVVLDERVAQATIRPNGLLASSSDNPQNGGPLVFQKAGIYPLYSFKRDGESWTIQQLEDHGARKAPSGSPPQRSIPYGFLSTPIADAALKISQFMKKYLGCDYAAVWEKEGLILRETGSEARSAYEVQGGAEVELIRADVLLIHEGITDVLQDSGRWSAEDGCGLYDCAPTVVRTSGRGQDSRYLPHFLPFVEFNEISGNIYGNLNKLALVKALLGAAGEEIHGEEASWNAGNT